VTAEWTKAFQSGFGGAGVGLSLLSMILLIVWLTSEEGGGLGARSDEGVTAEYFNWHPLLMSAAFLVFMAPASSAFEVFSPLSRAMNKRVHAALQTVAVILVICGYAIIYDCHVGLSETGLANSMHSIAGYMTMSMVGLAYAMGFVLYVVGYGGELRGTLKPLHKRLGLMSLLMGFTTLLMGMTEKANGSTEGTLVLTQVTVGLVVLSAVSVSFAVVKFVDKKDAEHKYEKIPDAAPSVVQIGSNRKAENFV